MLMNYDKLPEIINQFNLNMIKTHLMSNTIKNVNEIEKEIKNKTKKQMTMILDTTVDYMEATTGNKYGPQVFNNYDYLRNIENYYLCIKMTLLNKINKFKNIEELIALLQIKTIPFMINWNSTECITTVENIFSELGYSKDDYNIEKFFDDNENDICDIEISFNEDGKLYKDYYNDGLLLTYNRKEGIRIVIKDIIDQLILKLGGNE